MGGASSPLWPSEWLARGAGRAGERGVALLMIEPSVPIAMLLAVLALEADGDQRLVAERAERLGFRHPSFRPLSWGCDHLSSEK